MDNKQVDKRTQIAVQKAVREAVAKKMVDFDACAQELFDTQKELTAERARGERLAAAVDVQPYTYTTLAQRLNELKSNDLTDNQAFALGYVVGWLYRLAALDSADDGGGA